MIVSAPAPPFVVPVFIAHQGCPHQCVFCNQHGIIGRSDDDLVSADTVRREIERCLARPRRTGYGAVQVAFYGGSFTGLPQRRQHELLGAVRPYMEQGKVGSIRLSTRPDYVHGQTPGFLRRYGVRAVELGVQSMDPAVLTASGRGHGIAESVAAVGRLQKAGFQVGVQLMLGLPGERTRGLLAGAARIAELRPDFVRLYPTLVIRGSRLAHLHEIGEYTPLSLQKAVALAAKMKGIFDRRGIAVIRMGLQPSAALEENVLAGPHHPAFGELVLSRLMFKRLRGMLAKREPAEQYELLVPASEQSVFRGAANRNFKRLVSLGLLDNVRVTFERSLRRGTILFRPAGHGA